MFGIDCFSVGSWDTVHASSPPWSTSPPRRIDRILLFQLGLWVRRLSLPTTPGPILHRPHGQPLSPTRSRRKPCVHDFLPRRHTAFLCFLCAPAAALLLSSRRGANCPCRYPAEPVRSSPAIRDPLAAVHHPGLSRHVYFTKHPMRRSILRCLFVLAVDFGSRILPCKLALCCKLAWLPGTIF